MTVAHRLSEDAVGVYIISATPFSDDGGLDLDSLDSLTDFYLGSGVNGITVLGMMGEASKLTEEEATQVLARVLNRVDGRVPVLVGVSNPEFDKLVALARSAMERGAAGIMVAPQASAGTEAGVLSYMRSIAAAVGGSVPICYQDFPLSTHVPITAQAFTRMVEELPSVVMLKHEDWPGLQKLTEVRKLAEERGARRVSILCGNGGLYLPQELARGADGAMTGFAYPEMLVQLVARHRAGDIDGAEDLFDAYLPLVRYEQQPGFGLAVRKEILRRRGVIASAKVRPPGWALDAEAHSELTRLMDRLTENLERLNIPVTEAAQ